MRVQQKFVVLTKKKFASLEAQIIVSFFEVFFCQFLTQSMPSLPVLLPNMPKF